MGEALFNRATLADLIRSYPEAIQGDVDSWERNKVLAASESDLVDYLIARYFLYAPTLRPRDQWRSTADEAAVDVSHDFRRAPFRDERPLLIPGHRISVRVPFDGDADLFDYLPSTRNFNPPRATVSKSESVLTFSATVPHDDADANRIRERIDAEVAGTQTYLGWLRDDCAAWNARLPSVAADCLKARKRRLLQQADLLSELGIPLKRRDDAADAFSVPVVPTSRPAPRIPPTPGAAFQPEPAIADDDYEFILELIARLAVSIERNPVTFARLPEEHIRDHILVSLNSHFEGRATGETFNAHGKTDILIREQGANAFIGECKFWSGRAALHRALDQLLSYATWRDTKTALILFSRNKDFSTVLGKVAEYVPQHPNCKRETRRAGETEFRYVFGQKNDPSRDIHLAVLVFNVPPHQAT